MRTRSRSRVTTGLDLAGIVSIVTGTGMVLSVGAALIVLGSILLVMSLIRAALS